jgi:hypothetical protein
LRDTNLAVLGEIFRVTEPNVISEGESLWSKGASVDRMAFVLDGEFRTDGSHGICVSPTGATLGAWEILVDTPRFEGWIAERASRVLFIHKDLFIDLLEDHFEFAEAYLRRVNQQVTHAWDLLARKHAMEGAR